MNKLWAFHTKNKMQVISGRGIIAGKIVCILSKFKKNFDKAGWKVFETEKLAMEHRDRFLAG